MNKSGKKETDIGTLLLYLLVAMLLMNHIHSFTAHFVIALLASTLISKRAYRNKSLDYSGSLFAFLVGFVTTLTNYAFFVCLLTFFVTSSALTKVKARKKRQLEENYKEGGQRNAKQILCNGGTIVFISLVYLVEIGCSERPINFSRDFTSSVLITALIGTIACCNGDTWSSELGSVYGRQPCLITTLEPVPAGTNGGISLVGLLASACAGFTIGLAFLLTNYVFVYTNFHENGYPPQWPVLLLSTYAGIVGSLLDSALGAVYQYSGYCLQTKRVVSKAGENVKHISGANIMDNDQVNLMSAILMGLTTPVTAYYLWRAIA